MSPPTPEAAPGAAQSRDAAPQLPPRSRVAVVECASYQPAEVKAAVGRAVELLGGAGGLVPPGGRVLLKPNLLGPDPPDRAVCTHPALVGAVAEMVRAAGGVPVVGESSGGSGGKEGRTSRALRESGMAAEAERLGVPVENFDARPPVPVQRPGGRGEIYLAAAVLEADAVINLPKLKTHSLTIITGAIKNLFGCVPGTLKTAYHRQNPTIPALSALFGDIYALVRPRLTIVDAALAMEGLGPSAGTPRWLGLLVAGTDGVAVDSVAARIVGLRPLSVPTTRRAAAEGLGWADPAHVEVVGLPLERAHERARPFTFPPVAPLIPWVPGPLVRLIVSLVKVIPVIDPAACTACGVCAQSCPTGAVAWSPGSRPAISRRQCIECLCCLELCPQRAVLLQSRYPVGTVLRAMAGAFERLGPRWRGEESEGGGRTR